MNVRETWLVKKPIAHRGLHNEDMPENSLAAFENAIEHGYPIELDVRVIDDGTIIVFHDDKLGRITGKDGYASSLVKTDLANHNLEKTASVIPTFEQALSLINGKVPLLIELKNTNNAGELEKTTLDMLKNYTGEFAVQSFNPYSMEYFEKHNPDILRGQLAAWFTKNELPFIKRYMLSRLKLNKISKPHFISYCAPHIAYNKFILKTKLPVLAWTVRSKTEQESVSPFADNIIFEKFKPNE